MDCCVMSSVVAMQQATLRRPARIAQCMRPAGGWLPISRRRAVRSRPPLPCRAESSESTTESVDAVKARPAEKFMASSCDDVPTARQVVGTGEAECKQCQYVYSPKLGDSNYPVSPGTQFQDLPVDWRCPVCGAEKPLFISKSKTVAGFAENQGYGLGGNSLTSGQKSILIFGSLLFFFGLFMAGYTFN